MNTQISIKIQYKLETRASRGFNTSYSNTPSKFNTDEDGAIIVYG